MTKPGQKMSHTKLGSHGTGAGLVTNAIPRWSTKYDVKLPRRRCHDSLELPMFARVVPGRSPQAIHALLLFVSHCTASPRPHEARSSKEICSSPVFASSWFVAIPQSVRKLRDYILPWMLEDRKDAEQGGLYDTWQLCVDVGGSRICERVCMYISVYLPSI